MRVHAGEHYVHQLQPFSCYGHPVWHPVTRRLEGVLDITGLAADANPLLAALVTRAVDDIEQRLLDGTRTSERRLLAAFQSASGRRQRVLVAIGENVVLSNRAAHRGTVRPLPQSNAMSSFIAFIDAIHERLLQVFLEKTVRATNAVNPDVTLPVVFFWVAALALPAKARQANASATITL